MRRTKARSGYRSASAAVLVVGGGALAVATWVSGEHGFAIALVAFYVLAAGVAYMWSGGQGDVAAILRAGGDERQRGIDRDATAVTGVAMSFAAVVGMVVQAARGADGGGYAVMCVVAAVAYTTSIVVLRRKR